MEKKGLGCEANTKAKFNKGLVKEAKNIVSKVEGLNKASSTKRAADVRAAFGEKKAPAAAKKVVAKKPAAKSTMKTATKSVVKAKPVMAKAKPDTAAKATLKKATSTVKAAVKSTTRATAKPAMKVAKPTMKAIAAKPAMKAIAKAPVHKTAVGRAIAAVERAVGIKALAAPSAKGMRTTMSVAKPAGKAMAKATPKRPLPKPAGVSKGSHSGDTC